MGRRLSLMMVIILLASPGIPVARGQGDGKDKAAAEAAPLAPPDFPAVLSDDFSPAEKPADPVAKAKAKTKADPKAPAAAPRGKKPDATAKDKSTAGEGPAPLEAIPIGLPDAPAVLSDDFPPAEKPADPVAKTQPKAKVDPKGPAPATRGKKPDATAKDKSTAGDPSSLPAIPESLRETTPRAEVAGAEVVSPLSIETPANALEQSGGSPGALPPVDRDVTLTDGSNKAQAPAGSPPGAPEPVVKGANSLPASPAAATAPAGDAESSLSADHIPLGPQSVAVTVDVQAPKSMNLNQEAILRLVVRNSGSSDAINVKVLDELPEGLKYESSQPAANVAATSLLSWSFRTLPAGSEQVIAVRVTPVKTGAYDHAATVLFQTASRAQTQVFKPLLKVDQTVSKASVLKGQPVEFKIGVTNMGDGPARNVTIRAKLSPGLRHGSDGKDDEQMLELTIPMLEPNQREELDPLVVDAIQGGDHSCTVTATSPDVIPFDKETAENIKTVAVVEPRLKLAISAPEKRFTDTVATYEIKVENPGTATARKVRVVASLPVSGRLMEAKGAKYDSETRRLQWTIDPIEPGSYRTCNFAVRMGGIGYYEVSAEARGDGNIESRDRQRTEVVGMPDVDLVVSERLRVVDVGGRTTFQIRLRNYGTKEATNLKMTATLSKNLKAVGTAGAPPGIDGLTQAGNDGNEVMFVDKAGNGIKKLGSQQEIIMGITVEVTGADPRMATCKVSVTHDDLAEPFEDMARINVTPSRFTPAKNP